MNTATRNAEPEKPNAIFYGRVSTDRQASHPDQLAAVRAFCIDQGLVLDEASADFYDDAITGTYFDHPVYLRMLEYLRLHPHIGYLVVMDSSRFGRPGHEGATAERLRLKREFGVTLLSATQPFLNDPIGPVKLNEWGDPARDPTAPLRAPARALVEEQDYEMRLLTGQKSRQGVLRSLHDGRAHGGSPGLFFVAIDSGEFDRKARRIFSIQPDPKTRHLHQQMFDYYLSVKSLTMLSHWLFERGITTCGRRHRDGTASGRQGRRIPPTTLLYRLKDYKFIGRYPYNRYTPRSHGTRERPRQFWHVVDDYCESTVSEESFFAVQKLLERGSEYHTGAALLTGILRCGVCGRKMTTVKTAGYRGYRCDPRADGASACANFGVKTETVDGLVSSYLEGEIFNSEYLEAFLAHKLPRLLARPDTETADRLQAEIKRLEYEIRTAEDAAASGGLPQAMADELTASRRHEVAAIEKRATSARLTADRAPELLGHLDFPELRNSLLKQWRSASVKKRKSLLRRLFRSLIWTRPSRSAPGTLKLTTTLPSPPSLCDSHRRGIDHTEFTVEEESVLPTEMESIVRHLLALTLETPSSVHRI